MPFAYLKLADGQLLKVLTDDNGIIQQSYNGDPTSFAPIGAAIADGSVGTASIANGAVTAAKVATGVLQTSTTTTVSTPVQDVTVSGLDGDNDGDYLIDFNLTIALTGNREFTFQPNGLTTGQSSVVLSYTTGFVGELETATLEMLLAVSTTTKLSGQIYLQSKSGKDRFYQCTVLSDRPQTNIATGLWTGTATAITSVTIHSAEAGSITGGTVKLTKLRRT